MPSQLGICNNALELIKSQDLLTGGQFPNFTGSPSIATAANTIYGHVVQFLLRQLNPEFARITAAAAPALGVGTPIAPWSYEYLYPADGLRLRRVRPPQTGVGSLADPNDPIPIRAAVAFDPNAGFGSGGAKVVLTNQQNALLVYTSNVPSEAVWDFEFAEEAIRRMAHHFSMAIAGRPDWARELLEQSERYATLASENGDL